MTPAETAIREALAAGPTLWKCNACGSLSELPDGDNWCGDYGACSAKEGFVACNPAALADLLAELDGERNRSQMYADLVRGVAVVLRGEGWSDTSKLAEEVKALMADAERYRLLRNASMDERNRLEHYAGPELDAAIDAAKGGGNG